MSMPEIVKRTVTQAIKLLDASGVKYKIIGCQLNQQLVSTALGDLELFPDMLCRNGILEPTQVIKDHLLSALLWHQRHNFLL